MHHPGYQQQHPQPPHGMPYQHFPYGQTTPITQAPQGQTASDLAMAIKAAKQFTLPKLTKTIAKDRAQFAFWKKKVILTVSNDVALSDIVASNATEATIFDGAGTNKNKSKRLFHGLFNSFDTEVHQQINLTTSATTNMNSTDLWKELLSAFSHKALTFRARDKLIHNYKNFKPQKGESLDAIFIRFRNIEEELKLNSLEKELMDNRRRAGQILIEMQNDSLKQIAIGIWDGSRGKEWYDISLADLKEKVKTHLELLGSMSTSTPKKPKTTSNTMQMTIEETTPGNEFKYPNTVTAMEKQIIKAMQTNKKPATLLDLAGKFPGTCCIHPNKNHHFFQCLSLKRICRDNNWTATLDQATKRYEKINGPLPAPQNNKWQLRFLGNGKDTEKTKTKTTEETRAAAASAKQVSALESSVSDISETLARLMAIVDDDNNNEQDFINSLAVEDIEDNDEGGENTTVQSEEQPIMQTDNSKTTVNSYIPSQQSRSPTIYAKSTTILSNPTSKPSTTQTTTADSGATHDMSGIRSMFEENFPLTDESGEKPFTLLGDGTTTCTIEGYGYAT